MAFSPFSPIRMHDSIFHNLFKNKVYCTNIQVHTVRSITRPLWLRSHHSKKLVAISHEGIWFQNLITRLVDGESIIFFHASKYLHYEQRKSASKFIRIYCIFSIHIKYKLHAVNMLFGAWYLFFLVLFSRNLNIFRR